MNAWSECATAVANHNVLVHTTIQSPEHHRAVYHRVSKWAEWLPDSEFRAECLRLLNMSYVPPPMYMPMPMFYQPGHRKWLLQSTADTLRLLRTYGKVFQHTVDEVVRTVAAQRSPASWCHTPKRIRAIHAVETANPPWRFRIGWSDYMVAIYHDVIELVLAPWSRETLDATLLQRYLFVMLYDRFARSEHAAELHTNRRQREQWSAGTIHHLVTIQPEEAASRQKELDALYHVQCATLSKKLVLWLAELLAHVYLPCFPNSFEYPSWDKGFTDDLVCYNVPNDPMCKDVYASNHWSGFWTRWLQPGHTKFYQARKAARSTECVRTFMLDILTRHTSIKGHRMFPADLVGSGKTAQVDIPKFAQILIQYKLGDDKMHAPIHAYLVEAKHAELAGHLWSPSLATLLCLSADQRLQFVDAGTPAHNLIT